MVVKRPPLLVRVTLALIHFLQLCGHSHVVERLYIYMNYIYIYVYIYIYILRLLWVSTKRGWWNKIKLGYNFDSNVDDVLVIIMLHHGDELICRRIKSGDSWEWNSHLLLVATENMRENRGAGLLLWSAAGLRAVFVWYVLIFGAAGLTSYPSSGVNKSVSTPYFLRCT